MVTLVSFENLQVIKGNFHKDIFVVELPGGELPNGDQVIAFGTPQVEVGDRFVIFTNRIRKLASRRGLLKIQEDRYGEYIEDNHSDYSDYMDLSEVIHKARF